MDIHGKVVIITGASLGIGRATAIVFAEAGAKLALVARSTENLAKVTDEVWQKGAEAIAIVADVSDKAEVERMIAETYQKFGRIDVLINNAGRGVDGSVAMLNNDNFREIVELNLFGPLYAMQAVVPKMRENGGGVIINVSSMVTKLRIPTIGGYAATKAALDMLSQTARIELASDNIKVGTVYPGQTETEFGKNVLREANYQRPPRMQQGKPDTAEKVARKILEAVQKEVRDQYMSPFLRLVGLMSTVFPATVDNILAKRIGKIRK